MKFYWPLAKNTTPTLNLFGGATRPITQVLSALAGICFLAAAVAHLGLLIPASWWTPLVIAGAAAPAVLYILYSGVNAIIPLAVDALLLWGPFARHWTVAALTGG
jgi:hypothetical protein